MMTKFGIGFLIVAGMYAVNDMNYAVPLIAGIIMIVLGRLRAI